MTGRATRQSGVVTEFDATRGVGVIETSDASRYPFHCIEIGDGTRVIAVGAPVTFSALPKLGRYEAADIQT